MKWRAKKEVFVSTNEKMRKQVEERQRFLKKRLEGLSGKTEAAGNDD